MIFTAKDIINLTAYAEFPDVIINAELTRALAKADGRSIRKALNGFASFRSGRAKNRNLRLALDDMSTSAFPETSLYRIKNTLDVMEKTLDKSLGGCVVCESVEELKEMLDKAFC